MTSLGYDCLIGKGGYQRNLVHRIVGKSGEGNTNEALSRTTLGTKAKPSAQLTTVILARLVVNTGNPWVELKDGAEINDGKTLFCKSNLQLERQSGSWRSMVPDTK